MDINMVELHSRYDICSILPNTNTVLERLLRAVIEIWDSRISSCRHQLASVEARLLTSIFRRRAMANRDPGLDPNPSIFI